MILVTIQGPNSNKTLRAYRTQILKFLSKSYLLHQYSLTLGVAFKYFLLVRQRTELHCHHYSKNAKSSRTASLSSDFQVTSGCIYIETITRSTWKTSSSWPIAWPVSKECLTWSLPQEWKCVGFFQRPVPVYLFSLTQFSFYTIWAGWPVVIQINSGSESVD